MENQFQRVTPGQALGFLTCGLKIAVSKECRLYILVPVLVNLVLLSICGYSIYSYLSSMIASLDELLPQWLSFLTVIISIILALMVIFIGCYFFSTVATIIASPFYGLLADRAEMIINGTHGDDMTVTQLIKDVPRILKRELRKQLFFLPLAFLCLVITFVPVVHVLSPFFWFMLTAYFGCLQYADYSYDNHKISFAQMQKDLKGSFLSSFCIGSVIALAMSVPVVNILVPPAAVCAGTRYYVELQKAKLIRNS